jgi:hypothetical protein
MVAQTVLAGVTRGTIAEGERDGAAGRYRWVMRIGLADTAPPPPPDEGQPPPLGKLYRVALVVVAPSGRRTSLETFRIATAGR